MRWLGWAIGLLSFALSLHVAQSAINSAYWLTHSVWWMCGLQAGWYFQTFWDGPMFESFAIAGWALCLKAGAGAGLARVGVAVGGICWIGSWFWLYG
jgi:hypothetical protein